MACLTSCPKCGQSYVTDSNSPAFQNNPDKRWLIAREWLKANYPQVYYHLLDAMDKLK